MGKQYVETNDYWYAIKFHKYFKKFKVTEKYQIFTFLNSEIDMNSEVYENY